MYLSRLILDPQNRQVRKEFGNRYEFHRTLTAQFEGVAREKIGLLYRIEPSDPYEMAGNTVLVQTETEPCWDSLYERSMLMQKAEVKRFEPNIKNGDVFAFRLMANPTTRRNESQFAGKRVGLLLTEEQEAWLQRKGSQGGFKADQVSMKEEGRVVSNKMAEGKKAIITHQAVLFEGILKVNDDERFVETIKHGIGSAKAFGFGLLSLARFI